MVKSQHYDIIFLDIKLADMDGVETCEQIKKIDPQATVIMMTGYTEEDLVKRAVAASAYTCIYKPFDIERVITLVEAIAKDKR